MKKSLRIDKTLWLHLNGRTFTVPVEVKTQRLGKALAGSSSGLLTSPMPGKVLRVEAKVGEHVKKGQTICVIEAMKMEYALKAPFDSVVKEIFKKELEQIAFEEKVALLEE
jgi:biotin carboxyl carrier protein